MKTTMKTLRTRCDSIKKSLGARAAAGFLRNRGCSLNIALWLVCGQTRVRS